MNKFRAKLTWTFTILIGIAVLMAGVFAAKLLEQFHMNELEQNLVRELHVMNDVFNWTKSGEETALMEEFTKETQRMKEQTDARVTYIRADGKVLGDSNEHPSEMDNHLYREEIDQAAKQGIGSVVRFSDTLRQNMMYVAVPVKGASGQTEGYLRMAMSLQQIEGTVRQLWLFLLIGLLILFLLSGFICYRIARGITRPIERITRVARQMANQQYAARVPEAGNDEVGELARTINRMAENLQIQMQHIRENEYRLQGVLENMVSGVMMVDQRGTITLVNRSAEDILGYSSHELLNKSYLDAGFQLEFTALLADAIETHTRVREELMLHFPQEQILEVHVSPIVQGDGQRKGVLVVLHDITAVRRLERIRSEFVANVSHELKTPVAAVKGFAETLMAGALEDKEMARSFLQIIYDESDRLNRLIGDILELSKIESKRIPLQFSPVDVESIVENSIQMMKAEAEKKHITLESCVENELYIEADEDRLRQILINLLSNGISYTPEGGRVSIGVEFVPSSDDNPDNERMRIRISDTGIGIPEKDLPRIFERFYRVDKARSRSSGGTGLGLSIVKHLTELHHGTISVESEAGKGTTFNIELPVIQ
ncbi:alkaline phosphatase synthesis sensor protein PhoR [Paenibacillus larvae subsp. larvae]|uniref:histidine kinase n=1 Tax=Paenibacillus larvae subsp. larvae TaxID=147375 RepID=A0A2L1TX52_9BACL|nr:ATP-binding protein [Paenibacillus larvae]AQT85840.1 PAS domain-containing sensor histidine kinase [Paenibacillus larvae subsp. pulvifaciens]AQZ45931.1 PAS domain-containing sensor histidine kinase [Paenibacillus larvae subsp. pulvifaciens]AVF25256.1 alkaline phosphatase synthesis sensor protein PhoR [Paenibacillus larvae subsp. larvae]AVF30033.1 alkaline phosphatase synthesis sensor protein PhoR [Paenibacillus larvae subsp. larvae]MBH0344554.1 histidine kinase [Paenibacillus larvae]